MEVIDEHGAVLMDSFAEHLTLYSKCEPRNPSWVGFGVDPNQGMIQEFVDSMAQNRDPSVTWNDGYQALRVALAAYESTEKKAPVRL